MSKMESLDHFKFYLYFCIICEILQNYRKNKQFTLFGDCKKKQKPFNRKNQCGRPSVWLEWGKKNGGREERWVEIRGEKIERGTGKRRAVLFSLNWLFQEGETQHLMK